MSYLSVVFICQPSILTYGNAIYLASQMNGLISMYEDVKAKFVRLFLPQICL